MLPENRISAHPGKILQEQFLEPLRLTQVALAEHIGIPVQRISEIVGASGASLPDRLVLFLGLRHHAGILDQFTDQP